MEKVGGTFCRRLLAWNPNPKGLLTFSNASLCFG